MSDSSEFLDRLSVHAENIRALEADLADELAARDNLIRQAHGEGVAVKNIARVCGVSVQRVYRVVRGLS